jgi:drug/metabolite transporter (DMT)-like permease
MDPRRLRAGEVVAALAGAALLGSLFLPWYGDDLSGWGALGVIDVLLALVAALTLALALLTATQQVPPVPLALAVLLTIVGALAALLVLFRAVDLPDSAQGREWGLWLALAATLGVVAGGCLSMADERLSSPGRHTDASGRPAPPPAAIETISAARLDEQAGEG